MNRLILPYIFILSCFLCACQDIDDIPTQAGKVDGDIISLNVTVADNVKSGDPNSRATDDGMYTYFEPGDSVGVIVLDKDGKFIVNNAKFLLNDSTGWKYKGIYEDTPYYDSEMQTYIVYFPYDKSVTEKMCTSAEQLLSLPAFAHQEDQTSKAAFRSSDVMAWEWSDGPIKEIKAELRHLRNCVSLDITVQWELLTIDPKRLNGNESIDNSDDTFSDGDDYDPDVEDCREIITFKLPNEAAIKDKEGNQLKHFHAADGTFRYVLPDEYEGDVTYFYNYRESMFKGEFNVLPSETGTLYSKYETVDMDVYEYEKVIVGDFYCKNSKNHGFVLPCEATEYLDNDNHRCIGLVLYSYQHDKDIDGTTGNYYDYTETGIKDSSCHGYVLALTDVQNDLDNLFEWELNDSYVPYEEGNSRTDFMGVNIDPDDWGGYFNTLKILTFGEENEEDEENEENEEKVWYRNWYPAAYAAYYYGNLVSGTVEVGKGVKKNILFNNRDKNTPSGGKEDKTNSYAWQAPLQAPDNTSGWYLPGNGMLIELQKYQSLFEQRYEEIKEKLDDKIPYKEHIGWIKYHYSWRGTPYYWSSSESNFYGRALSHEYSQEKYTYPSLKSLACAVRAVLAY